MTHIPTTVDDVEQVAKSIDALAEKVRKWKAVIADAEKAVDEQPKINGIKGVVGAIERLDKIIEAADDKVTVIKKRADKARARLKPKK